MEIAGYHIVEPLAKHSLAAVYLARHEQSGGKRYAIKVLDQDFVADPNAVAAFLKQAQRAQQIRHPGFVKIFESGEYEGAPYYVMEFIPGVSLEDKRRSMCLLDKIYVVTQVARSLDYIATLDSVHGNITPAHILLHEVGSGVILKETGFTQEAAFRSARPDSDHARYTAGYASPEQADGGTPDPRSDIYSLGAVLYTLLVGEPPVIGDGGEDTASIPHLPETLRIFQPMISKSLAASPAARFQSFREFVAALERIPDERILQADGVEPEPVRAVADEAGKSDLVDTESAVEPRPATAKVVPFTPRRESLAAERAAGDELAQVFLQEPRSRSTDTDDGYPAQETPQANNPTGSGRSQDAKQSMPGNHDRRATVEPLRAVRDQPQFAGRPAKVTRWRQALVLAIVMATLVGLAEIGMQHRTEVAEWYRAHLEPVLPSGVAGWVAGADGIIADLDANVTAGVAALTTLAEQAKQWVSEQAPGEIKSIAGGGADGPSALSADPAESAASPQVEDVAQPAIDAAGAVLASPSISAAHDSGVPSAAVDSAIAQQAAPQTESGSQSLAESSQQEKPGGEPVVASTREPEPDPQALEQQRAEAQARVADLLRRAQRQVREGQLLRPASDNAVITYREILVLDPENESALVALGAIKRQSLQEVQAYLDSGALDSADALITRIGIFFQTARPELKSLSVRLQQLRTVPPARRDNSVLTRARFEGSGTGGSSQAAQAVAAPL